MECVGASWNVMNTHDVNSGLIRVKVSKGVWEERSPDGLKWKRCKGRLPSKTVRECNIKWRKCEYIKLIRYISPKQMRTHTYILGQWSDNSYLSEIALLTG